MVANSAVEDKHHLSTSSASPDPDQLQHRDDAPNPKQKSASVAPKYSTHFPTFNCKEDCSVITDTASQLELSGFYWGPLGVEEAHRMLRDAPLGSFLIRDSRQKDVFFTLSYHAKSGPVSVRIDYKRHNFSLAGNERTFSTLFALLEYYINCPKRSLKTPYRKWKPTLQELCRRRVMEICDGATQVSELPLTKVVQDFLMEFPYQL
uniref:suppressor of cytokine signaling 1a n=1 Tax=Doryrhamphus excisus TaxID=161450 RepID=UPI0025AE043B|nr:suppressor of cytokine signaling 1a [Doryrhamphus excisus]